MNMVPVPLSRLSVLEPFMEKMLVEANLKGRATMESLKAGMLAGYQMRNRDAYVDSLENPKHCLVFSRNPGFVTNEDLVIVLLIYSMEEERGRPDIIEGFMRQIDSYAEFWSANAVLASSWVYLGSRGIDVFWKSHGYELQERVYTKLLKGKEPTPS